MGESIQSDNTSVVESQLPFTLWQAIPQPEMDITFLRSLPKLLFRWVFNLDIFLLRSVILDQHSEFPDINFNQLLLDFIHRDLKNNFSILLDHPIACQYFFIDHHDLLMRMMSDRREASIWKWLHLKAPDICEGFKQYCSSNAPLWETHNSERSNQDNPFNTILTRIEALEAIEPTPTQDNLVLISGSLLAEFDPTEQVKWEVSLQLAPYRYNEFPGLPDIEACSSVLQNISQTHTVCPPEQQTNLQKHIRAHTQLPDNFPLTSCYLADDQSSIIILINRNKLVTPNQTSELLPAYVKQTLDLSRLLQASSQPSITQDHLQLAITLDNPLLLEAWFSQAPPISPMM